MRKKPGITVDDLMQIAEDARSASPPRDGSDMARGVAQNSAARSFVSQLCGAFGKEAGNRFAAAIGFDHLIKE